MNVEVFPDISGGSITKCDEFAIVISSSFSCHECLLGEGWEYTSTVNE